MPISDYELERMELKYLNQISNLLQSSIDIILENLRTRIQTYDEWYPYFRDTARPNTNATDLDRGAERVIGHYLAQLEYIPVSAPIGSDFMYETDECYFNLDIKTALATNDADYKGKIPIGENQTSYKAYTDFNPKLPEYYHRGRRIDEKPCLTYAIQIINMDSASIIRQRLDHDPIVIRIFVIPNGQLQPIYTDTIVRAGKTKRRDGSRSGFRYFFKGDPLFRVIKNQTRQNEKRYRILWLNENYIGITIDSSLINYVNLFGFEQNNPQGY